MSSSHLNSAHDFGGFGEDPVMFQQGFPEGPLPHENLQFDFMSYTDPYSFNINVESESSQRSTISTSLDVCSSFQLDQQCSPNDDSSFRSASPIYSTPICREFWKAGNYDESYSKSTYQSGSCYLQVHPKFLHSNATSHKWVFGAIAELLDNAVDEIQNGATFVNVDKIFNPRDGTPALLIQDDGCGMDPVAMRSCLSFGFSDKKSNTAIGQYGNGFKTSSMRLGADVIVFSRCMRNRKMTQSIGLLSYTFLVQTKQDTILVPMVDYEFDAQVGAWNALQNEDHFKNNLSIFLRWSPFTTQAELLKQCDDIECKGTRIIVYNLWHNDEGSMELDFESDPEDIVISGSGNTEKTDQVSLQREVYEQHLANRLQHSLRAYLSILYLKSLPNFCIVLCGRVVECHNIACDLKYPEFIVYKPLNVEGSIITTIGFLKEAPTVNIHGFNVYHKNRLIMGKLIGGGSGSHASDEFICMGWSAEFHARFLANIMPFWRVVSSNSNRGRGIVGVLEANFMQPTHNKQDFEKTPVFLKLEARLKTMTNEYWDYHCGLIGYSFTKLKPPSNMLAHSGSKSYCNASSAVGASRQYGSSYFLPSFHQTSHGASSKRKELHGHMEPERVRMDVKGPGITGSAFGGVVQDAVDLSEHVQSREAANLLRQNKNFACGIGNMRKPTKNYLSSYRNLLRK